MTRATSTVKQADLMTVEDPTNVQAVARAEDAVSTFERLARDSSIDVERFERLMAMQERALERVAKEQFNAAMSTAQQDMRPVATDATNPQTKSRYASYAHLDRALRPIYTKHGFALSFNTGESPVAEHIRVLCDVTHNGGWEKQYHVDMPNDGKGAKGGDVMTKTHATGAALTYGCRYLLKLIFNVAVGEDDTDGNMPGDGEEQVDKDSPEAFGNWLIDMETVAREQGSAALFETFNKSKPEFQRYLRRKFPRKWDQLKSIAQKTGK